MSPISHDPRAMAAKERAFHRSLAYRTEADEWTQGLVTAALHVAAICAVMAWVLL